MKKDNSNMLLWIALAGGGIYLYNYYKLNGRFPWQPAPSAVPASLPISTANQVNNPPLTAANTSLPPAASETPAAPPVIIAPVQAGQVQGRTVITPEQSPAPGTENINPYTSSSPGSTSAGNGMSLNKIAASSGS